MKQIYKMIAVEIKKKISELVPVSDMRVFGSCARNEDTTESDIDIYVELEYCDRNIKKELRNISWQYSLGYDRLISLMLVSRNEAEKTALKSAPIMINIKRDGVPV